MSEIIKNFSANDERSNALELAEVGRDVLTCVEEIERVLAGEGRRRSFSLNTILPFLEGIPEAHLLNGEQNLRFNSWTGSYKDPESWHPAHELGHWLLADEVDRSSQGYRLDRDDASKLIELAVSIFHTWIVVASTDYERDPKIKKELKGSWLPSILREAERLDALELLNSMNITPSTVSSLSSLTDLVQRPAVKDLAAIVSPKLAKILKNRIKNFPL